jgi:hypothetical protein
MSFKTESNDNGASRKGPKSLFLATTEGIFLGSQPSGQSTKNNPRLWNLLLHVYRQQRTTINAEPWQEALVSASWLQNKWRYEALVKSLGKNIPKMGQDTLLTKIRNETFQNG